MFASRVSVLKAVTRMADGKQGARKKSKTQAELDLMKASDRSYIQDRDMWENSKTKLRFRKFPWGHWFMGFCWLAGVAWVMYEIKHDLFRFKYHKILKEYLMLFLAAILGIMFLYKGKIRHTIFDKKAQTLTIKKRNTCCDKRSIVTYSLKDISDVKAVYRGYKQGGVDTQSYMCIVEMEKYQHEDVDTSDAESFSSSDEEREAMKRKTMRDELLNKAFFSSDDNGKGKKVEDSGTEQDSERQELKDTVDTSRASGMTLNEEVEQMKRENIQNLSKQVENAKDPYRRGVYHPEQKGVTGLLVNRLDKGVREKRGRKEEVKILETRNKQRIEREVLAIRKFLRMDSTDFKVIDERRTRMQPDKID